MKRPAAADTLAGSPVYEVEQKFRVDELSSIEDALGQLGAPPGEPVEQVDTYLAHPARDFAQTDEALRIRRVGPRNFVTYKGPKIDATTKTRREIELPLPPGEETAARWAELFLALGFVPAGEVVKTRRKAQVAWRGAPIEVVLDQVQRLGTFVELEMTADEAGLDLARQSLASLAQRLGLSQGERRSYLELLLEKDSA